LTRKFSTYNTYFEKLEALIAPVAGQPAIWNVPHELYGNYIDITDMDEVFWALARRSDPERSIDVIRRGWNTPLDPMIPSRGFSLNSRIIIEACRPYEGGWFSKGAGCKKGQLDLIKEK
jgi:hypothetical protein